MPAVPSSVPPKLCLHKASGRACVHYRGRVRYLGAYDSPESKEAYARFLMAWQADRAGVALPPVEPEQPFTVLELCWAYFQYAEGYYRKHGHWHPNQLRHSKATEIRRQFGLEAAQVVLGHAKADVPQIYAERDSALAVEVMKRIG